METRTGFRLDRLSLGDWIVAVGSLALLIDILVPPWYGDRAVYVATLRAAGRPTSATATQAYHLFGSLGIVLGLGGLAVWAVQGARRAPALPLCLSVLLCLLGLVETVGLVVRVVFAPLTVSVPGTPGVDLLHTDPGAVIGMFCAAILTAGAWMSIRTDAVADGDAPRTIQTLALAPRRG